MQDDPGFEQRYPQLYRGYTRYFRYPGTSTNEAALSVKVKMAQARRFIKLNLTMRALI